jgi:hypothetical protein
MLEKNAQIKPDKKLRLKWLGLLTIVMASWDWRAWEPKSVNLKGFCHLFSVPRAPLTLFDQGSPIRRRLIAVPGKG